MKKNSHTPLASLIPPRPKYIRQANWKMWGGMYKYSKLIRGRKYAKLLIWSKRAAASPTHTYNTFLLSFESFCSQGMSAGYFPPTQEVESLIIALNRVVIAINIGHF